MKSFSERDMLARRGDYGQEASALRLKACRAMAGIGQEALGFSVGLTKSAISNAENAQCFPSRQLMVFYFREYGIDFNFLIAGEYAHLPKDVQDSLFDALLAHQLKAEDDACR